MRLSSVRAKGYRTLNDVDWPIGALNVLIGPNGTGKSNLLSFLSLISESAKGNLERTVYSYGGMSQLLFDGQGDTLTASVSTFGENSYPAWCNYQLVLRRLGLSSGYVIESETAEVPDTGTGMGVTTIVLRPIQPPDPLSVDLDRLSGKVMIQPKENEAVLSFPFLSDLKLALLKGNLASWSIHHTIRTDPASAIRQAAVARRADTLDANCDNLVAVLHTHYTSDLQFRERIDSAMYAAFGDNYQEISFPPGAEQQVQLAIRWSSLKRPAVAATLSDGTLRFLAIITALSQPNLPALIAIDEPETGLHPTMMRIIAEYAADAALRSQIIFTTHSAAFLDAFDRQAPPQTTVVSMVDGQTVLKTVDAELLDRWLKDYSLGALYRSRELENMPGAVATQPAETAK